MVVGKSLKIILAGLDAAGKSSLLVVMKNLYDFEEKVKSLKPTTKIDYFRRDFLNYHLSINDMGGQEKYRERYLQREVYFELLDALVYLIDIKAPERVDESLNYLDKIINILIDVKYKKSNPIFICFSKMDENNQFTNKLFEEEAIKKVKNYMKTYHSDFNIEYHYTSIYNVYSVIHLLSNAITAEIPEISTVYEKLNEFSKRYDLVHVLLLDYTGMIISEYPHPDINKIIIADSKENVINHVISDNLQYFKKITDENLKEYKFYSHDVGNLINICYKFYTDNDSDPNPDVIEEKLPYYISVLISKDNKKKEDWSTFELVDEIKSHLDQKTAG